MQKGIHRLSHIDWILFFATIPILGGGLITMYSFVGESTFFNRQLIWILLGFISFFSISFINVRFLKRTNVLVFLFLASVFLLLFVLLFGDVVKGAKSWILLGPISFQPADPAKLVLILIFAKYFSRRHIEIAHIRHILLSGFYMLPFFILLFLQPDFGSALIIFLIWFGMIIVSGISKRHLFFVFLAGITALSLIWTFGFTDSQKQRVVSFLNPLTDIQGTGYNAYQSTISVGSGEIFGKGVGFGTQSRLEFLPEYQTDFIFAAFSEEWGYIGSLLILVLFGVIIWRILQTAMHGASNFEILYGAGLAIYFMSHITIHVGMNIGLLPVTGLPLPLMSYGGSHLVTEFIGLGILMAMRKYARPVHRDALKKEFVGY